MVKMRYFSTVVVWEAAARIMLKARAAFHAENVVMYDMPAVCC